MDNKNSSVDREINSIDKEVNGIDKEINSIDTENTKIQRFKMFRIISLIVVLLLLIPATIYIFSKYGHKQYYVASFLCIGYILIPFFLSFEGRKPASKELVTLAVMTAIAVVSRGAFAFVPHFKPMAAIIIITGACLGPETGFMCGALSALVSNFIFGQGYWTPWQILAFGIAGFLGGIFGKKLIDLKYPIWFAIYGFIVVVFISGPILDTSSVFVMLSSFSIKGTLAIYGSGFIVNVIQGAATFITILLLSKLFNEKLDRLKKKYGMYGE